MTSSHGLTPCQSNYQHSSATTTLSPGYYDLCNPRAAGRHARGCTLPGLAPDAHQRSSLGGAGVESDC